MVDISKYTQIYTKEIKLDTIVFDPAINQGKYCCMSYNNNKHGCPNFNKANKPFCPPHAPYYAKKIKEWNNFTLVYAVFDFKSYKEEMKQVWIEKNNAKGITKPPTEKQVGCNLYWQLPLKNLIYERMYDIINDSDLILSCGSGFNGWYSLEAVGIDVFQTYRNNDIDFEERPINKIVMCALIGKK